MNFVTLHDPGCCCSIGKLQARYIPLRVCPKRGKNRGKKRRKELTAQVRPTATMPNAPYSTKNAWERLILHSRRSCVLSWVEKRRILVVISGNNCLSRHYKYTRGNGGGQSQRVVFAVNKQYRFSLHISQHIGVEFREWVFRSLFWRMRIYW